MHFEKLRRMLERLLAAIGDGYVKDQRVVIGDAERLVQRNIIVTVIANRRFLPKVSMFDHRDCRRMIGLKQRICLRLVEQSQQPGCRERTFNATSFLRLALEHHRIPRLRTFMQLEDVGAIVPPHIEIG